MACKDPQLLVIDFSEDTKSILKELIAALKHAPSAHHTITADAVKIEAPVSEPKISLTKIREMINEKAEQGKTKNIVSLLGKYNAKNASSLGEADFDAFYSELKEL